MGMGSGTVSEGWTDPAHAATRPMSLRMAPETILAGRYRVVRFIAEGGMGTVYEARDVLLGERIALKTLRPELADRSGEVARLRREVRLAHRVTHRNVCRLHDLCVDEAREPPLVFLTMELLDGPPLNERLRAPITPADAETIARDIIAGMAAAHAASVIHRDLKPRNVVLSDGRAVVTDLGLARASVLSESASISDGAIVGTPAYMAPEQASGGEVTTRSDVYALGVLLNELLPEPDWTWREVIRRCLERDPARRFADAGEVERAIAARLRTPPRARVLVIAGIAALLVAAAVVLGLARGRERGEPSRQPLRVLAVLPLQDDSAQPHFARGFEDDLIARLARHAAPAVIARGSTARFEGETVDPVAAARLLGADAVVVGSVAHDDDRIRVSLRLRAATGEELWWLDDDVPADQLRTLEQRIERALIERAGTTVAASAVAAPRGVDLAAWQEVLQGGLAAERWTREGHLAAIEHYRRAIARDPEYAEAWASMAGVYGFMALFGHMPTREAYVHSRAAAERAVALDPSLAIGHSALAWIALQADWNLDESERHARRGVALAPSSSAAHAALSYTLACAGKLDESVREHERALALDPLSPTGNLQLGWVYFYAGRHEESLAQLQKALELAPEQALSVAFEKAWNYMVTGRPRHAERVCDEAARLPIPDDIVGEIHAATCGGVYAAVGRNADVAPLRARLDARLAARTLDPYDYGLYYLLAGDRARAFDWFERSIKERSPSAIQLGLDVRVWGLGDDPRARALLAQVGLPLE